jgi:hypothetical protein
VASVAIVVSAERRPSSRDRLPGRGSDLLEATDTA